LALAINRVSMEVDNVVNQRSLFIEELDGTSCAFETGKVSHGDSE
ncbi:hypothetical protein Tco_1278728, partial [Tanacetum coccineum]